MDPRIHSSFLNWRRRNDPPCSRRALSCVPQHAIRICGTGSWVGHFFFPWNWVPSWRIAFLSIFEPQKIEFSRWQRWGSLCFFTGSCWRPVPSVCYSSFVRKSRLASVWRSHMLILAQYALKHCLFSQGSNMYTKRVFSADFDDFSFDACCIHVVLVIWSPRKQKQPYT